MAEAFEAGSSGRAPFSGLSLEALQRLMSCARGDRLGEYAERDTDHAGRTRPGMTVTLVGNGKDFDELAGSAGKHDQVQIIAGFTEPAQIILPIALLLLGAILRWALPRNRWSSFEIYAALNDKAAKGCDIHLGIHTYPPFHLDGLSLSIRRREGEAGLSVDGLGWDCQIGRSPEDQISYRRGIVWTNSR